MANVRVKLDELLFVLIDRSIATATNKINRNMFMIPLMFAKLCPILLVRLHNGQVAS